MNLLQDIENISGVQLDKTVQSLSGGCIHQSMRCGDVFLKINSKDFAEQFQCEAHCLNVITSSKCIKVPEVLAHGKTNTHAFLLLEYLPLQSLLNEKVFAEQLAIMHSNTAHFYGWEEDNYIGATPQPNKKSSSWVEFWLTQRMLPMLQQLESNGIQFKKRDAFLSSAENLLQHHSPSASLLHGDLWSGNVSALDSNTPVIYDPACYYGDAETDLAMTRVFGGFSSKFYSVYEEINPSPAGAQERDILYQLYHILNHALLFGGSYVHQSQLMMKQLSR